MARSADAQRGIGRGHSQGSSCSSARREHRSVIPDDFPAEDRRPEEIRRRLFVAGNGQMSNHNDLSKEVCKKEEAAIAVGTEKEGAPMILGGRESPASSLLIFGDDDQSALSSVSSVSPTSVTQLVSATAMPLGGEKDPSFLRRVLAESLVAPSSAPAPLLALAAIDLHRLIDDSNWTELNRVLGALQLSSSAPSSAFDRDAVERALESTNSRGETPVHTLAWKAPTELVLQALDVRGVSALLSRGDRDLNTPLHLACANVADRSDFAVIRQIAFLAPHALALRNDHGDTPLHLLVSSPAFVRSADFLKEAEASATLSHLIGLSPEPLASASNRDDATLLHVCLAAGAHERVIHAVLDAAPDAARHKDHRGLLPLHYVAAFGGTPWPVVAKLIKMFPDSVRATTADGDTPLHLLMSNGAKFLRQQQQSTSDEAVCLDRNTTKLAELLMGNDATIMATNGNHQSPSEAESSKTVEDLPPLLMMNQSELNPLHVSACFDAPPQLIKILLDSVLGPKAAFATTSLGSTPLHLACAGIRKNKAGKSKSSKRLLAVVEALATPEACAVRDSLGRTPLMLAVQNKKADRRVIRALVRALPASIEHRTANGYLPLHLAVQSKHCRDSVIKTLIAEYPKSIFEKTVKGDTALHEACLVSKIPYDVVELLVRKYPGAVDCENDSLELPIDRARAMGLSKKICTLLLETSKNNKITAKPKKEKNKSTAVKVSSAGNAALRAPDGSTKTVGFFVPQLQGPSSRQRRGAAPDPPAEDPSTISRSTDPTPMRRRDVTPEAPRSLLGPVDQHSRRTNVVPASQLKPSPERRRGVSIVEPFERTKREGRSVDRRPFAARRAMSVTHDPLSTSSLLGFSCQRARTRSPTRRPLVDASTPKPVLERRTKSEANMQPPIARKRVTRLSKDESTSAITKGDVYRFEI